MAGNPGENNGAVETEDAAALTAIEELVAEFGVRAVVSACLCSSAGEQFALGGNGALRVAQVILREIVFSPNPQLEAEIMALGAGILLEDHQTITAVARKHRLTKAAVSKRVIKFCDENKLPPSSFMRSKKDRATYALTNQPRTA